MSVWILALMLAAFSPTEGSRSYVVTCSDRIIPGIPLQVRVSILSSSSDVTVEARIVHSNDGSVVLKNATVIGTGLTEFITLQVPHYLPYSAYDLSVVASGGLSFTNKSRLIYDKQWPMIYVQTDKTRYSAGQEVKFRVIFLQPNLLGFNGDVHITIYDGKKNKVHVIGPVQPRQGVAKGKFLLSKEPVFGNWRIEGAANAKTASKIFEVNEYVLPQFNVTVELPSDLKRSDAIIPITVTARFTFKRAVTGNCTLEIYNDGDITYFFTISKPIVEVAHFDIRRADLENKGINLYKTVNVRVLVSDNATTLTVTKETDMKFTTPANQPNQLQISLETVDATRLTVVPGLSYYTTLLVRGKADNVNGSITVSPTVRTAEILYCEHNNPPQWMYITNSTLPTFNVNFDESGYAPLKFHVPLHTEMVWLTLTYGGVSAKLNLISVPRNAPTMLRMSTLRPHVKTGESALLSVESTQAFDGLLLVEVMVGGYVVYVKRQTVYLTNSTSVSIPIQTSMVPQAYVLASHITPKGELVSDYVLLHVDGSPFQNNVSASFSQQNVEPGNQVQMEIKADPDSVVYVLSEDKTNRLIGTENDVYFSEIRNDALLRQKDVQTNIYSYKIATNGHQASHDAYGDVKDVFIETGAILLSDTDVFDMETVDFLPSHSTIPRTCVRHSAPEYLIGSFIHLSGTGTSTGIGTGTITGTGTGTLTGTGTGTFTGTGTGTLSGIDTDILGFWLASGLAPSYARGPAPTSPPGQPTNPGPLLQLESYVRSRFPETWIWDEYLVGPSGELSLNLTVPDSITSWVTSVFATNDRTGFGLPNAKYEITVHKQFFMTMDVPSTIIQGEEFLLQLTVFNYMNSLQEVYIRVMTSEDPTPLPTATRVMPGKGHSTFLHLTPKNFGVMKIRAVAKVGFFSVTATDTIEKEITVKPHGVHRVTNEQHLIEVFSTGAAFSKTIALKDVENMVNGTKLTSVKITGNFMVPSIDGLDNLINMPSGCGEQTMLSFAPDIYVSEYLKTVGKLTKKIETKITNALQSGLQNELSYQHSDGSFSAFGNRDGYGSSWLTAFVLKCFRQADGLIYIDNTIMSRALTWLLNYQNADGSFYEPGRVIHTEMQSGTTAGIKLTAFILNSVLENRNTPGVDASTVSRVIQRGHTYLETRLASVADVYTLAIVCYSLVKAGSSQTSECHRKILATAVMNDGQLHWEAYNQVTKRTTHRRAATTRAAPADIEATAYNLLTLIELGETSKGLAVVKWLVSQRNTYGGFVSTQDTVIALQALSEFSSRHMQQDSDQHVQLHISNGAFHHYYNVTSSNADVIHTKELPHTMDSVIVKATGTGVAVVDVSMSYYMSGSLRSKDIGVTSTLTHEALNSVTVQPCISWYGAADSGMVLMEVEMPTGFVPDVDKLKAQSQIKRHDGSGRIVALYFDGMRVGQSVCVEVKMDRSDPVVKSQACHITVYDYYNPTTQAMTRYESGVLKSSNICNVCPLCTFCTETSGVGMIGVGK